MRLFDNAQRFCAFAIIAMFSSSLVLGIAQPVTAATAIPKGFASREACIAGVQAFPAADIAAYSKERSDNRLKTLDKYMKQIDNKYKKSDASLTKATAAYKKKVGTDAPSGPRGLATSKKDTLKSDVTSAIATVKQLQGEVDGAGGNQAVMAEKTCAVQYDLRIYSYFNYRLRTQYAVDGLRSNIAVNQYQYEAAQKLYEKNQSKAEVKAVKGAVDSMPKPSARAGEIDAIQQKLDAVTIADAGTEPFKAILENVSGAKKNINTDRTKVGEVARKVTGGAKKKAKKASTKSTSSSPSSSGSSSSSSTATTKNATKTAAKKTATLAEKCKKQKGKEVRQVKGKSKCVTACNSQEVVSARNAANCVCPQDHRRPPGKPRACVNVSTLACPSGQKRPASGNCLPTCKGDPKKAFINKPCFYKNTVFN